MTTPSIAPVILDAAWKAREALLESAADILQCERSELRLGEGGHVLRELIGSGLMQRMERLRPGWVEESTSAEDNVATDP